MDKKIIELQKDSENAYKFFSRMLAYIIGPAELKELMDSGKVKIVDVREKSDYEISHIPSAISVPSEDILNQKESFSKDETYVLYCYNQQCKKATKACLLMASLGFPAVLLEGGFKVWTEDFHFAVSTTKE